jgi:LPXTG-site transpeptidase (sortase) family protein
MKYGRYVLVCLIIGILTGCSDSSEKAEKNDVHTITKNKESVHHSTSSSNPSSSNQGEIIKDQVTAIIPAKIEIPAIDVQAHVEQVGTIKNGQMGVPKDFHSVGWYKDGAMPGDHGNAVMAGHVDSKTGPAVFYKLESLKKGDQIIVSDKEGKRLTFEVIRTEAYPRKNAPVDQVFGFSYRKKMNLITCTGNFNRDEGTHEKRLVVYTELTKS